MNVNVKIIPADHPFDLEGVAHALLMRAEVMLTLADRYWKNIADDARMRHAAGSVYEELAFQHHQVHMAALTLYNKAVS